MSTKSSAPTHPARHRLHLLLQPPGRHGDEHAEPPDLNQLESMQISGWLETLAQAENMADLAANKINSLLDAFNQMNGTDGVRLRLAKAHILNALDEMEGLRVRLRRPI